MSLFHAHMAISILSTRQILSAGFTTERFGLASLAGLGLAGLACLGFLGLPCLGLAWLASQPGLSLPTATTMVARSAAPPAEGGRVVVVVGKDEPG